MLMLNILVQMHFNTLFEVNAADTIATSDLTCIDQYGREITTPAITVTPGTAAIFTIAADNVTLTAPAAAGSETLNISVPTTNPDVAVNTVTTTMDVQAIAVADVTSYALEAVSTIYEDTTAAITYEKELVLVGKTATGSTVVLNPGKITLATSSKTTIGNIVVADRNADGINEYYVNGVDAGTFTAKVYSGATFLAQTTVTVSDVAPAPETIVFDSTTYDRSVIGAGAGDLTDILTITDQYGVDITAIGLISVASSNTAIVTSAGVVTAVNGTVDVIVTTTNGLEVSATLTVQA